MIHNFVVPEVEKQIIRKQIKQRQTKYLQEAHACIYDQIENLPPVQHQEEGIAEGELINYLLKKSDNILTLL